MRTPILWTVAGSVVLAVLVALAFRVDTAMAKVWDEWDWHLVDEEPKRHLHYCVSPTFDADLPNDNIDWDDVVDDAVATWNAQTAVTGWSLEEVPWGDARCQIKIQGGEIGPGYWADTHVVPDGNGRVTTCTIRIDPTPPAGDPPAPPGGRPWGRDDGTDAATSWNTRWTMIHELGHCMRLDHSATGQIMRPDVSNPANDDDLVPNANDITEATAAKTAPIVVAAVPVTPSGGGALAMNDFHGNPLLTVSVPPNAVALDTTLLASVGSYVSTPDNHLVPGAITPIIRSVYLRDEAGAPIALLQPATITIYYADMFDPVSHGHREGPESVVVPTGSGLSGASESTLQILTRTAGIGNPWLPAMLPTIDTVAHTVSFSTNELRTYGMAGNFEGPGGGVAEPIPSSDGPLSPSTSSGRDYTAPIAAVVAGAVIALAAGGWYVRRRLS